MSEKNCHSCGCTEIDEDPARGNRVCTNCGSILEEQIIVSEIQFQERAAGGASVMGQFVSVEDQPYFSVGAYRRGLGRNSQEVTLQNARKLIQQVGNQLHLNSNRQDVAFNYYKLLLKRNLTRGRKSNLVVASCLYLVCRRDGIAYMLLDFSDILRVNVYTLGRTYLYITRVLYLKIPVIDPCMYIDRFAHRLDFGDKRREVCSTAMRLVQRMGRDWMNTGRRPSGLCGAALLVSARMNNFNRTVKEIIKVVKVCESTVRKRLREFEDTPSGQLTIEEFHNIDLEEEQDPPCFIEGKKRSKLLQFEDQVTQVEKIQQEIEKSLVPKKPMGIFAAYAKMGDDSVESSSNDVAAATNFIEEETLRDVIESPTSSSVEVMERASEKDAAELSQEEQELMKKGMRVPSLGPTLSSLGLRNVVEECITVTDTEEGTEGDREELDLTGIDDEEIDSMILTEEETKKKTELWMTENADYLQAQKEREERRLKEEQEQALNPHKKKRKYRRREKHSKEYSSANEAMAMMIQEHNLSTKINYDVLKDVLEMFNDSDNTKTDGKKSTDTSTVSESKSTLKRNKRPGSTVQEEGQPAKKKKVTIQETASDKDVLESETATPLEVVTGISPALVVEEGLEGVIEAVEEDDEEEDEDEDEDEAFPSAQSYFGSGAMDEGETYDDDEYGAWD